MADRREALAEAFEQVDAAEEGREYTPPVEPVETDTGTGDETTTQVGDETLDPAEVEQKAAEKAAAKKKEYVRPRGVPPSQRKVETPPPTEGEQTPQPSRLNAPQAWKAAERQLWSKVPPEAQAVISRRETEIQQAMSRAGNVQKIAQEYADVIHPFEPIIRSMNSTPRDAITNVMKTATALIVGTQEQKAAVLVEMITRYGVDIPALDKALTGALEGKQGQPNIHAPQNSNAPIDPRIMQQLQPLFQLQTRLQEAELNKNQELQESAVAAINSVQNEPYFEDVRDDMADIMEISAKRGVVLNIKQAYDKACQLNPEIAKLLPKPRTNLRDAASTMARARRARSTVSGAPGAAALTSKTNDRRAQLEAAWDETA